jgi:hypothetical protein
VLHPTFDCFLFQQYRLAADGLDMLTELVGEGSHAAKGMWQDAAAAAGRLHEQIDQSLAVSTLTEATFWDTIFTRMAHQVAVVCSTCAASSTMNVHCVALL